MNQNGIRARSSSRRPLEPAQEAEAKGLESTGERRTAPLRARANLRVLQGAKDASRRLQERPAEPAIGVRLLADTHRAQ